MRVVGRHVDHVDGGVLGRTELVFSCPFLPRMHRGFTLPNGRPQRQLLV